MRPSRSVPHTRPQPHSSGLFSPLSPAPFVVAPCVWLLCVCVGDNERIPVAQCSAVCTMESEAPARYMGIAMPDWAWLSRGLKGNRRGC